MRSSARRGRVPDRVGKDRVRLVDGRAGEFRAAKTHGVGLIRARPRGRSGPELHCAAVGPNQPRAGGALPPEYHLAQVSRLSEFLLHPALPHQRRIAGEPGVTLHPRGRRSAAGIAGGASSASLQRPRLVRGTGACERRRAADVCGRAPGWWRKFIAPTARSTPRIRPCFADLGNAPTFSDNLVEIEAVGD